MIAGGCGFIGTNLIRLLNESSKTEITVLDNESVGKRADLEGLRIARFIHGDVRDPDAVDRATANQDAVVVLAAQTSVVDSIADPEEDCDINLRGGLTLLKAAVRHGTKCFVFASSTAPLGVQPPPVHEDMSPRPQSPYGASKLAMEGYCSAFYHAYGLNTVALRFSNCYGTGSYNRSIVVAQFMKQILAREPITIFGDGEQTRDFIYVDDLCRAIALALDRVDDQTDNLFGQLYQVATGVETSINRLIEMLLNLVQSTSEYQISVRNAPARPGEILRSYADISRIRERLGFEARVSLEEGLRITWDYFRGLQK